MEPKAGGQIHPTDFKLIPAEIGPMWLGATCPGSIPTGLVPHSQPSWFLPTRSTIVL